MSAVEWVFEGPDPDVGIFGDLILHPCDVNVDEEPAEDIGTVSITKAGGRTVEHLTKFRCVCGDVTVVSQECPIEHMQEPRDDRDD